MLLRGVTAALSASTPAIHEIGGNNVSRRKPFDVRGKTILITGGGSGIGAASARLLHSKGANIILLDLNGQGMAALTEELGAARTMAIMASVTDRKQLDDAVESAFSQPSGTSILKWLGLFEQHPRVS